MNTDDLLLSTIINSIPYFIFWKNREGVYLGTNDLFAKSAGFSNAQEIVGKTDCDCCWTKEESDFYRSIDKKVMDNDEPILNIEEPQKQLNGETRILLTSKVENLVTTECKVNFSRIALSQAFLNLLLNGRNAMVEANSPEKVLYLKGFPTDKYFTLEVSDSGPGILEEILPNIFVPFFTTKPIGEGTGIGLSLSKSMIENQGGRMKLKNHKPNACFEILIPLEEV